jgi:hypothetical protein
MTDEVFAYEMRQHRLQRQAGDDAFMRDLQKQHPDLAAAADVVKTQKAVGKLSALKAAETELRLAVAANANAKADPSPLARQRAADHLKQAEQVHDTLRLELETFATTGRV